MELTVLRHTITVLEPGICYGQTDVPLASSANTDFAYVQMGVVIVPEIIISSPLQRSALLAHHLAANLGCAIRLDEALMEMNFGHWEGMPWDAVPAQELADWMPDYKTATVPGGEGYPDVELRIMGLLDLLKREPYQRVMLVTHAGPIRIMMHLLGGVSIDEAFRQKIGYGQTFQFLL